MPLSPKVATTVLEQHAGDVANTPPGPEADSKAAKLLQLFSAMLSDATVAALIPNNWKGYVAAVVAVIGLVSSSSLFTKWVSQSAPTPPAEVKSDKTPASGSDSSPIVPPAANKVIVYRTTETPQAETDKLPVGSVDPKRYAVGSSYPFAGKMVPLPCVALISPTGAVIDVRPFTTAADTEKMLKK